MKDFEKLTPQEKISELYKLQDIIKDIQKLSWKSTQIMKRFPLEQATEHEYSALLKVYSDLIDEIRLLQIK